MSYIPKTPIVYVDASRIYIVRRMQDPQDYGREVICELDVYKKKDGAYDKTTEVRESFMKANFIQLKRPVNITGMEADFISIDEAASYAVEPSIFSEWSKKLKGGWKDAPGGCKHEKKRHVVISKNLEYDYCPDCKKEVK